MRVEIIPGAYTVAVRFGCISETDVSGMIVWPDCYCCFCWW